MAAVLKKLWRRLGRNPFQQVNGAKHGVERRRNQRPTDRAFATARRVTTQAEAPVDLAVFPDVCSGTHRGGRMVFV